MLDYEWANPPPIMLNDVVPISVAEPDPQPEHNTNLHYSQTFTQPTTNNTLYFDPNDFQYHTHNPAHPTHHYQPDPTHFTSLYNTGYALEPAGLTGLTTQTGFMFMPKTEPEPVNYNNNRIGLNLGMGGRTYFSSAEDELVNRLYGRSRAIEPAAYVSVARCQAEGCNADLTHAKHYHRRHKVCEFHSKASTVIAAGLTQRFCQQCSRFHLLLEFDNGKRSCRRRLADHNRRRRKSSQNHDHSKSLVTVTSTTSSSSNITLKCELDSRG